jgi:hypothetical protein
MSKRINRPRTILERCEGLPPPHPPNPRPGQWVPPKNTMTPVLLTEVNVRTAEPSPISLNDTAPRPKRKMMSVYETAEYWGVHFNTIGNWTKTGKLPCVRVPGCKRVLYDPDVMDECARKWQNGGAA